MMSKYQEVRGFVFGRIKKISENLGAGSTKALLAQLRRGIGKHPGELPELWGIFLNELPKEYMSQTGEPSREEWAIYTTLTLFALHQQGHDSLMHIDDDKNRLGCAVSRLSQDIGDDASERILSKLSLAAQSSDMEELSYRLRTLVKILRDNDIKLNYVDLAGDLYNFQFENSIDKVRLKWGQDFYCTFKFDDNRKDDHNE